MRRILLILILCTMYLIAFSQGEIPVDMYTGQPQIDIPICTITDHDISVPISLTYNTAALRFTDYGGAFGMGWELSGIGSVSREVRGLPDDFSGTSPDTRKGWLFGTGAAGVSTFANSSDLTTGCTDESTDHTQLNGYNYLTDTEPDIFNFNLGSLSGSFIFDNAGTIRMLPYRDIKITKAVNASGAITSFTITTNTGYVYKFESKVYSKRIATMGSGVTAVEFLKRDYELYKASGIYATTYTKQWKLTRIESPSGASITFTYGASIQATSTPVSISLRNKATSNFDTKTIYTIDETDSVKTLTSAYASSGGGEKITISGSSFVLTDTRNAAAGTIKTYSLAFKTFSDTGRKFLTSLTLTGGCDQFPPYTFTYQGVNTSATADPFGTNVNQQDFWGYYNGANGNTSLYPTLYTYPALDISERYRIHPIYGYSGTMIFTVGADRAAKLTDLGSLSSITYPTEGVATFDFEPNVYYDATASQDIPGGGLRIKTVKYYDALQSTAYITKNFTYSESLSGHSSGRILSKPVFAIPVWQYKDFSSPVNTKTYTTLLSGSTQNLWEYLTVRTENNIAMEETSHGSLVVYKEVKVARPNTGYVRFEYALPGTFGDAASGTWSPTLNKIARASACPTAGIIASGSAVGGAWAFPYSQNSNFDFERGHLIRQTEYNEANKPVRKTQRTYQYIYKSGNAPAAIYGLAYEKYPNSDVNIYLFGKYSLLADIDKTIATETVKTYDDTDTAKFVVSVVEYVYGSSYHKQMTQVKSTASDGTIYRSKMKYPLDFTGIPSSGTDKPMAMIKALQDNFRHGSPVEQVTTITQPGQSEKTVSASLVKYNDFGLNKILPEYQLSLSIPDGITDFADASMQLVSSVYKLVNDSRYETVNTVLQYDGYDIPASQKGVGRVTSSVHIGYDRTLPVVQATYARDDEFAFADFETSTGKEFTVVSGFTQYLGAGRTGRNAHYPYAKLTRTVTKASVSNYVLSFWINSTASLSFTPVLKNASGTVIYNTAFSAPPSGGTGFTYVSVTIPVTGVSTSTMTLELQAPSLAATPSGGSSSSLLPVIDDLAFYPEGADLVSFTYAIPHGVSSFTDARKRTAYTEYDGLGRVKYVKDHERNIIHKSTYKLGAATAPLPVANISASATTVYTDDVITFTATGNDCVDGISNIEWNMGTGAGYVSGSKVKTYSYPTVGTYTVTLRITHGNASIPVVTQSMNVIITSRPLEIGLCAKGVATYNSCTSSVTATQSCASISNTPTGLTTYFKAYQLGDPIYPDSGPFTYTWQVSTDGGTTWSSAGSTQQVSRTLSSPYTTYIMKCTMTSQTAPYRSAVSYSTVYVNCD